MQTVMVLGAGAMGSGIAQVVAQAGYQVLLQDIEAKFVEKGLSTINKNLGRFVDKGKIAPEKKDEVMGRIKGIVDLTGGKDIDLVIEAVIENQELKRKVYQELDSVCKPEAIFASNTSSLRGF